MTTIRKHIPYDVMEELEALVEAHIEKAAVSKQRLSREQAMVEAIGNRPDLYARYEKERLEGRYARQEERPVPPLTSRGSAREQLVDLARTRAARVSKRAGESDEQHLARFLDSDEGRRLYAAYERV
jgi:hypothetical protein